MVISKAARRYAGALLSLATEQKKLKEVHADMQQIAASIDGSRELLLFLRSPIIRRDKKSATLVALFSSRVDVLTLEFLKQLAAKGRDREIPSICRSFLAQYDIQAGIERVSVTAAHELDEASRKALAAALNKKTGKEIILTTRIEPSLIGGIRVQVGDTIYDGSVRSSLDRLSDAFINNVA